LKGTNSKDSVKMDNSKDLEIKDEDTLVRAKVAGTFYRAESPDSTPFVQVGQKVKKGDVLGMIEAMKMMNNITSPIDGEVLDIVAGNEDLVGYDDILIVLKKV
jgi:biotin carboxyl carrier protein